MGDRGNVQVIDERGESVWLYSHWGGSDLASDVLSALQLRARWNDAPYLARIIFSHMVPEKDRLDTVGYGISTRIGDNEHLIVQVDTCAQAVRFVTEDGQKIVHSWAFKDYVELSDSQVRKAFE